MTDIFQRFVRDLSREYGYFYEEAGNTLSVYRPAQTVETGAELIGEYKDTKTSSKWVKASKALIKLELAAA